MTTALEELGYDVEGWKGIAAFCGFSETTVNRRARDEDNPLPARKVFGQICAKSGELRDWLRRHVTSPDIK